MVSLSFLLAAIEPAQSQLTQILRYVAKPPQHDRVGEFVNVRITGAFECDGSRVGRIPRHPLSPPDRGAFALAFLRLTSHKAIFRSDEGNATQYVTAIVHALAANHSASLTARALWQELDLRNIDLASSVDLVRINHSPTRSQD